MDAHDFVPLIRGHVEDHALAKDAVSADEGVEFSVGVEREADEALRVVHGCNVTDGRDGFAASAGYLVHDRVDSGRIDTAAAFYIGAGVGDDDFRALRRESPADLRPHPTCAPLSMATLPPRCLS